MELEIPVFLSTKITPKPSTRTAEALANAVLEYDQIYSEMVEAILDAATANNGHGALGRWSEKHAKIIEELRRVQRQMKRDAAYGD